MALKKVEQIKQGKWVRVWDIIAYAVLSVLIIALLLSFTVGRGKTALVGFKVAYKGETVFTYNFDSGEMKVLDGELIAVDETEENADEITVKFTTPDKKGFNKILISVAERWVRVTESNCSTHKDCVYTTALKNNSSTPIICTPHALSISPLTFMDDAT